MSENTYNSRKKYKKPKELTSNTTNPRPPVKAIINPDSKNFARDFPNPSSRFNLKSKQPSKENKQEPLCPLLAKDSEWVDIVPQAQVQAQSSKDTAITDEEEEVLQLEECEDGPELKPLAIMFPDLLEKDPQTLLAVLDKAISTTEVTRRLVDLGQKANFTFMKKSSRLIPKDKLWLEKVSEDLNSTSSDDSDLNGGTSHDYQDGHKLKLSKSRRRLRKKLELPLIVDSGVTLNQVESEKAENTR